MVFEGFIGPSAQSDSLNVNAERTMNLYLEAGSGTPKARPVLYGTPGLSLFGTLPKSPVRALFANETTLLAIAGDSLYSVASNGTSTLIGAVGNDGKPAQIFWNGQQQLIVSNGVAYCNSAAGLVQATTTPLTGTVNIVFQFGHSVVNWVSGAQFSVNMAGATITINGVNYTVNGNYQITPTQLHLTTGPAGTVDPVPYSCNPALLAGTGAFMDTYFIVSQPNTQQFNISALNDGNTWAAIDFGTKEGYPDNLLRVFADHEELWLFGTSTTEVWQNTGNANFPFQRIPGAFIHHGCAAPYAVERLLEGVAWITTDAFRGGYRAVMCQGFQPVRISTPEVEAAWDLYSTVSDAVSFTYVENGHEFWVITFPSQNATWCFDSTSGQWTQRGWWNTSATSLTMTGVAVTGGVAVYSYSTFAGSTAPTPGQPIVITGFGNSGNNVTATVMSVTGFTPGTVSVALTTQVNETHAGTGVLSANDRQRQMFHAFVYGEHIVGDWSNGKLYVQSLRVATDDGNPIAWERTAAHLSTEQKRISYSRFQLDAEAGTSLSSPAFKLSYSDDGGHTYSNPRTATPSQANYAARYIWRMLGSSRDRIWRVTGQQDVVRTALIQAILDFTVGTS